MRKFLPIDSDYPRERELLNAIAGARRHMADLNFGLAADVLRTAVEANLHARTIGEQPIDAK